MRLRYTTRLKIAALKKMAKWWGIPMQVHEEILPEVRRAAIDNYIAECAYLLDKVYLVDSVQQFWKFNEYAYDHMLGDLKNPFLLHEHPLYYAGEWLGIQHFEQKDGHTIPTSDPRFREAEERFRDLVENDEYYKKRFVHGWRCGFGVVKPSSASVAGA